MFDIEDLQKLRTIWLHFSTVLLSRYTDDNVKASLNKLASIITKKSDSEKSKQQDSDSQFEDECEFNSWKLPESDEHKSMYQSSMFFQDFKTVTFDHEFEDIFKEPAIKNVSPYHSSKFCDLFLQKYISILGLWTCAPRIANSPEESHFKNTKQDANSVAAEIVSMPLKAGRFIRFIKQRSCRVTESIKMGVPRYRNTKNKIKELCKDDATVPKRRKIHNSSNISNVYKVVKQRSATSAFNHCRFSHGTIEWLFVGCKEKGKNIFLCSHQSDEVTNNKSFSFSSFLTVHQR